MAHLERSWTPCTLASQALLPTGVGLGAGTLLPSVAGGIARGLHQSSVNGMCARRRERRMPPWRTGRLRCRRMGTLQRGKCTAEVREQTVFLGSADLGAAMGLRGALRPVLWRR